MQISELKKKADKCREEAGVDVVLLGVCATLLVTQTPAPITGLFWQVLFIVDAVLIVALFMGFLNSLTEAIAIGQVIKYIQQQQEIENGNSEEKTTVKC